MNAQHRSASLSARLRSEVLSSAALWQTSGGNDKDAVSSSMATGSRRLETSIVNNSSSSSSNNEEASFPCPREVKPLLFFYKYLQPIGDANCPISDPAGANTAQRKLRVNLPLTVVCERNNGQEVLLWLRTDAQGNVVREDKTPLWRKKLHSDLLTTACSSTSAATANSSPGGSTSDPVLAVRSVARWKSGSHTSTANTGGSAVVLTKRTLDAVLAVPCELPVSVQQFVQCRGSQASVYRVFWCPQERKCFAVNLTNGLKSTEAPHRDHLDADTSTRALCLAAGPAASATSAAITVSSSSSVAAVTAAYEAAMASAAQLARFYCVTVSPDARACARWPKLRGAPIAEGVQATTRIVEHVQTQLPALRFDSMTVDFIKDTQGVWWLTRVVDFHATSCMELSRDNGALVGSGVFGSRDSAVQIAEFLRAKPHSSHLDTGARSLPGSGDPVGSVTTPSCFLCGSQCEFSPTFQEELLTLLNGESPDDDDDDQDGSFRGVGDGVTALAEYRLTLTMALDTIYLLRQRGVVLPTWEAAVQNVRKTPLRGVCEFTVCLLCYHIYQQQHRLQKVARMLHSALAPAVSMGEIGVVQARLEGPERLKNERTDPTVATCSSSSGDSGLVTSSASVLTVSKAMLSFELRSTLHVPAQVLAQLEAFQHEAVPQVLQRHGAGPETRPTWSALTPVLGADVDPTATQLRLVFFFHELQDGGPDLVPTDFFLEYQLGQTVTRVQLEGSKRHTPNRWQLCEARVHYLCATLGAFSEFCTHKRLMIKMKAKPQSSTPTDDTQGVRMDTNGDENIESDSADDSDMEFGKSGRPTGKKRQHEEFFGYAVLSLRPLITAAKWFGHSLQPECRTDHLLELHTASYALLTLKVTVGLLVDPVPLSHVRDILRDRVFLEEQPPRGVYWPPPTHFLSGLAVPRDWVGALMPSEYISVLPMRSRKAYPYTGRGQVHASGAPSTGAHTQTALTAPRRSVQPLRRQNSAGVDGKGTTKVKSSGLGTSSSARRLPIEPLRQHRSSSASDAVREKRPVAAASNTSEALKGVAGAADNTPMAPSQPETHLIQTTGVVPAGKMLTRACLAAKRIVYRITSDATTSTFPTALLASILRLASFVSPSPTAPAPDSSASASSIAMADTWTSPASFFFTRKYSVDRLLVEVRPGGLPVLALLAELLLVLLEYRVVPVALHADRLESLLEPFWQQDSGWHAIPRVSGCCVPEHRVIWNRAIRRWEAVSGADMVTAAEAVSKWQQAWTPEDSLPQPVVSAVELMTAEVGGFRSKCLALALCELFEQMEALDNGYVEIAELRSLAKCLPVGPTGTPVVQLKTLESVGTRERLSQEEVGALAVLMEHQRRLGIATLLRSLMNSSVVAEALACFDRDGTGEVSLQEFRELASEALRAQREIFHAFHEEPKEARGGFCLRHGLVDLYSLDSACLVCTAEFRVHTPPAQNNEEVQSTTSCSGVDSIAAAAIAVRSTSNSIANARTMPRRASELSTANLDLSTVQPRSFVSPSTSLKSSLGPVNEQNQAKDALAGRTTSAVEHSTTSHAGSEQRAEIRPPPSSQFTDDELNSMLGRLQAAERLVVQGERRLSVGTTSMGSTRRSSIAGSVVTIRSSSSCSDLLDRGEDGDDRTVRKKRVRRKKKSMIKAKSTAQKKKDRMAAPPLPTSTSLSALLRVELQTAQPEREAVLKQAARVEARRKQLDRLVLDEVQGVQRRLAKLLQETN